MRKYLRGLVIAALGGMGLAGCTGPEKQPNTVRPARPDEPRESRKNDVPPSISNLLPQEVTPDNFEHYVTVMKNEMDRDQRDLKRSERRSATNE